MIFTFLFLIKQLYIDFLLLVYVEIHDFYLSVSYKTTVYRLSVASVCRDSCVLPFCFL